MASSVGDVPLDVPRDRAGTFAPVLVPKGSCRLDGLDDTIISLCAGGMTVRDVEHHLAAAIGVEISRETISEIIDAVGDEVRAWQSRPLEEIHPIWGHLPRSGGLPRRPGGEDPPGGGVLGRGLR